MQQGGRPGGARFAQFKLVLLGASLYSLQVRLEADDSQENPL
jgi:hypothetical protein